MEQFIIFSISEWPILRHGSSHFISPHSFELEIDYHVVCFRICYTFTKIQILKFNEIHVAHQRSLPYSETNLDHSCNKTLGNLWWYLRYKLVVPLQENVEQAIPKTTSSFSD